MPIVRRKSGADGVELVSAHWGLIPFWAKDRKIGAKLINARAETVAEKPAFRAAFKSRRCLVPADGFYEWRREGKVKQPFLIESADSEPMAFAGLWETWKDEDGKPLVSCTIITTEANAIMREIHNRMPVILDNGAFDNWLADRGDHAALLRPCAEQHLQMRPVDARVNNVRNNDAELIEELVRLI